MRASRWLLAIWFCFLARAFFYCAALPLWEGYDEWSHFAVVQRMAFRGEVLVSRHSPIARDVAASLQLAPVAWECRNLPLPSATYDRFWRLPPAERARRESEFRAIPSAWARQDSTGGIEAYEGSQGPLAAWIMSPVLLAAGGAPLSTQVLLLRWFGVAILSLVIPLTFLTARSVFRNDGTAGACAAIVAAMPGLLIGIARVSNECVAVVLFTLLLWLAVEELTRPRLIAMGAVLGLGLLAKAYFLTAVPPVALLLLWKCRRPRALLVPLISLAIAGWWYVRNLLTTGTLAGMWESAVQPTAFLGAQLHQATHFPWLATIDSILFSHLWLGAWSTLTVRSWMYHLFYLLIALAILGLALRPSTPAIRILAAFFLTFWLGQLYHAAVIYTVYGMATSLGCYLYAVAASEVTLCVAGLRALSPRAARRFVAPSGVALFALFDFYTLHMVALPYYTGLVAHRPGGPVAAFHPATVSWAEGLARLAAFKSPLLPQPVLGILWVCYAAATLGLVASSFAAARREPSA
jgi:4-amino-4-deoxy-L-arabinose transferase-like glycosyltransferase